MNEAESLDSTAVPTIHRRVALSHDAALQAAAEIFIGAASDTLGGEDAPLIRLAAEVLTAQREISALGALCDLGALTGDEYERHLDAPLGNWWSAAMQIAKQQAKTPLGLQAKAAVMLSTLTRVVCTEIDSTLDDVGSEKAGEFQDLMSLSLASDMLAWSTVVHLEWPRIDPDQLRDCSSTTR